MYSGTHMPRFLINLLPQVLRWDESKIIVCLIKCDELKAFA